MNKTFDEKTSVDSANQDPEGNQDLEDTETPGLFAKGATRTMPRKDTQQQEEHANAREGPPREGVEDASVIDVLGEWAASCSVHGVPHAFDSALRGVFSYSLRLES
jgi:hypothetical protein